MRFQVFSSGGIFSTPDHCLHDALEQAAQIANSLSSSEVVGFSQSFAQHNMAFVTVWYRPKSTSVDDADANRENLDESDIPGLA